MNFGNLSGRNKMLLGVAGGVVLIAIVVVIVAGPMGGRGLFGAAVSSCNIVPQYPAVMRGLNAQVQLLCLNDRGVQVDLTPKAEWTISDAKVAGVNNGEHKGLITAVTPGTANVTAKSSAPLPGTAATTVNVFDLKLTPQNPTLERGQTMQLNLALETIAWVADFTANVNTQWMSSNPAVATVDSSKMKGLVTAIGPGTAIIYASGFFPVGAQGAYVVQPTAVTVK